MAESELPLSPRHDPDPSEAAALAAVRSTLWTLPEAQHQAFVLRHWSGLSQDEIADVLDSTPGAVESLLIRARRALVEDQQEAGTECSRVRSRLVQALIPSSAQQAHIASCRRCRTAQSRLLRASEFATAYALVPRPWVAHTLSSAIPGFGSSAAVATSATAATGGGAGVDGGVGGDQSRAAGKGHPRHGDGRRCAGSHPPGPKRVGRRDCRPLGRAAGAQLGDHHTCACADDRAPSAAGSWRRAGRRCQRDSAWEVRHRRQQRQRRGSREVRHRRRQRQRRGSRQIRHRWRQRQRRGSREVRHRWRQRQRRGSRQIRHRRQQRQGRRQRRRLKESPPPPAATATARLLEATATRAETARARASPRPDQLRGSSNTENSRIAGVPAIPPTGFEPVLPP